MDNLKLPKTRPSAAARQDLQSLTGDLDTFLPKTLSKQAQKRQLQVLEETQIRVVVTKATAVLEKLVFDYRVVAKRYELNRFHEELLHYQRLLDQEQPREVKNVMQQAVAQFITDLYTYMWDLSSTVDEQTRELIQKGLYPENEEERDWLDKLGIWMGKGRI